MRRENGFSFIEMLYAVAVIAILAAIATPSFVQMRQNARSEERRVGKECRL